MKSYTRVLSTILVVMLAVFVVSPSLVSAQVRLAQMSENGQTDCTAEIVEAVMEVTEIEDQDELIEYVDGLEDEEVEALLEEAGVAELAETCEIEFDTETACEELVYVTLAAVTEIEDEDELAAYLEELDEEELDALFEEAGTLLAEELLAEATGIEDIDELEAYLAELSEEELETLFEETGIYEIEDACADDDLEDLPEECLTAVFEVLVEATGIEDEDEMLAYLDELEEEELDTLLDDSGAYDIIDECDVDMAEESEEAEGE